MTNSTGKRPLPLTPHPNHLRKEAKARLAGLKERMPSAKLTDVQLILAREYGFANWAALQAEVACRQEKARYRQIRRQSRPAPRPYDPEETPPASSPMLVAAATASIFYLMAGIGSAMVVLLNRTELDQLYRLHDAATLLHKFL